MPSSNHKTGFNTARRRLLQKALVTSGVLAIGPGLWNGAKTGSSLRSANATAIGKRTSNIPNLAGTLHEITVDNDPSTRMLVPRGFSVREVARTGQPPYSGSEYLWHADPDGGAVFAKDDGGWVYVSNAEIDKPGQGGVGALRFNASGDVIDSYSICSGTTNNCAGGPTPWGTWLSCEEIDAGLVYECDPTGKIPAVVCPALGAFKHEAAAVDPVGKHIYLTEDTPDGNFYCFVPDHYPDNGRADLRSGRLQVAVISEQDPLQSRLINWLDLPNATPGLKTETPTRKQIAKAEKFNGGEGCWYHNGIVYFTTKGDSRVWAVDTASNQIDLIYDKKRDQGFSPDMDDVDNITVSSAGDIIVAEDGAEMRLVVVGAGIKPFELVNVLGHRGSEITGPDFSPDGSRLYFSSQNGIAGDSTDGRTYEMRGPFFI